VSSLRLLFTELESSEVKELSRWCNRRDTRFDILANLPLELVLQVLRYVDLRTGFRCRRTSQRWALVLSSETLSQAYIQPWYSREGLSLYDHQSPPLSTELGKMAEHIDAFCTGRPFSVLTMPNHLSSSGRRSHFDYHRGHMMWYDEGLGVIEVLDFKHSTRKRFAFPSRQPPHVFSEKLIVFYDDSGKVEVINHVTGSTHRLRLSSGNVRDVIAIGGAVAILHDEYVTTWNTENQKTCQFCTCLAPRTHPSLGQDGIYITTKELDVVYYEVHDRTEAECAKVSFVRYKLDGTPLTSSERINVSWGFQEMTNLPKPPISTTGLVGNALQNMLTSIAYYEVYDHRRYRMTRSLFHRGIGLDAACCWKDIFYEARDLPLSNAGSQGPIVCTTVLDSRDNNGTTILLDTLYYTVRYDSMSSLDEVLSRRALMGFHKYASNDIIVMGDEDFMVLIRSNGMVVIYCFDREANLSALGKELGFRYINVRL
jgi:hypothetical protein